MRYQPPNSHRNRARAMRADATKAENLLWQALRRNQLGGLTFRRQYPLDGYILDFVCFRPKLVVEVDGGQHAESASDARRDAHFRDAGFAVLRFWNDDVIRNIDGVCAEILAAAGKRACSFAFDPPSCLFQGLTCYRFVSPGKDFLPRKGGDRARAISARANPQSRHLPPSPSKFLLALSPPSPPHGIIAREGRRRQWTGMIGRLRQTARR